MKNSDSQIYLNSNIYEGTMELPDEVDISVLRNPTAPVEPSTRLRDISEDNKISSDEIFYDKAPQLVTSLKVPIEPGTSPSEWPVQAVAIITSCGGVVTLAFISAWAQGSFPADDDGFFPAHQWMLGVPSWKKNLFSWHPILMTTYFVCQVFALATWGFITDSAKSNRQVAKSIHFIFHLAGTVTLISGMVAVVSYINPPGSTDPVPTVNSVHQWAGVASIIMFGVNFLLGSTMGIYTMCISDKTRERLAKVGGGMLIVHRIVGLTSLMITAAAVLTGIQQFLEGGACETALTSGSNETIVASSYKELSYGCKLGNGLGVSVCVTIFLAIATFVTRSHVNTLKEKYDLISSFTSVRIDNISLNEVEEEQGL